MIVIHMITRIKATNFRCFTILDFIPNSSVNIIVGGNEAGKSTILEVISLVLSGRLRGRWASDDLNPYWFNHAVVHKYFEDRSKDQATPLPTIDLELYFTNETVGAERLRGIHNSRAEDCPGLRMLVEPDESQASELEAYLANDGIPALLPTDLYQVAWRSFAGEPVNRQVRGLGFTSLNAQTVASAAGIDYRLRQLLREYVTVQESAAIALQHRRAKAELTGGILSEVNRRIASEDDTFGVSLQMDQSAESDWEAAVAPYVANTPFPLLGQGRQVATKIALAMNRRKDSTNFVLVEEPENHLSHTELHKVLESITSLSAGRQLFITTHSSFVLNRLGFGSLQLIHDATLSPFNERLVSADTIAFFQKLSGYDTLRLVISEKVVVVEGPSDEMVFALAYEQITGRTPRGDGLDVIALGTSGQRALELAKALNRKIAVLRDNDGKSPEHWRAKVEQLVEDSKQQLFVSDPAGGPTLEPQIVNCNDPEVLRTALGLGVNEEVEAFMTENKTEWAWRLAKSQTRLNWPSYFIAAIEFINGD